MASLSLSTIPSPLEASSPQWLANAIAGWTGFLQWAAAYRHEIAEVVTLREPIADRDGAAWVSVSAALSASYNFGYDAETQTIFLAVETEEYEWLPLMPIKEVVIGQERIYILTHEVVLDDGEKLMPLVLEVFTNQPQLWRVFTGIKDIGFMCVRFQQKGYFVEEYADERYPIRFIP